MTSHAVAKMNMMVYGGLDMLLLAINDRFKAVSHSHIRHVFHVCNVMGDPCVRNVTHTCFLCPSRVSADGSLWHIPD